MSSALGQKEQSIVVSDKLQTLRCGDLIVPVRVGATDTAMYYPRLAGKRVALLANHTSMIGERHLVDILHARGFDVTAIFAPEHGFRGTADPGEHVEGFVDAATGIPIRSLYDGNTRRPSDEAMHSFDVLVVDMQDVGVRFYTYYIAMLRMMDACADFGQAVIVLDRPNPNGMVVDGPILEERYEAGGEYVCRMIVEGYAAEEIRNRWREDIGLSRIQRKPSLLYEERPLFRSIRE